MNINPIAVTSRSFVNAQGGNESNGYINTAYNGYGYVAPIGYNHRGIEDITRIVMSLKSGLDSEVKWALSTLTRISLHPTFSLEALPYIGHELIKYFIKPYHLIIEKKSHKVTQDLISFSIDALLTLRNSAQDLPNQQWLAQIKPFKKSLIEVSKFLVNWFYHDDFQVHHLRQFDNQFHEALSYLIDLLEPLTCYYIDNSKHDPLFNVLLSASVLTKDKILFINLLKCLSHLLITREKVVKPEDEAQAETEDSKDERIPNNCIDAITDKQLEHYVNTLLVGDNELTYTVLEFLKSYLFSEALSAEFPNSIKDSQSLRLQRLLQLSSTKSSFNTLVKQLPILIVSNLPLNESTKVKPIPQLNLTKRSQFSGVPSTLPELTADLYKIIVRFPEPLRATTWLRCCYEPYAHNQIFTPTSSEGPTEVIPGEVTQISLWKAYENQFQEIWDPEGGPSNPDLKPLLPAVDFIKNVSHAFPNSEAMVVNLEGAEGEAPKKKFIIKGIQPRQFAVNIDVGNYDALKPSPISSINPEENYKLPIGHIDHEKFSHILNGLTEDILAEGTRVSRSSEAINQINLSSYDLLDYIVTEVLENSENYAEENIFRLYNSYWLPQLVYANPSLLEGGLINSNWLKYLI
ncbi:chromatin remodeling protein [Scheffersomyces xylosifermentans]|uniref:chromatin remodeling protein n=1 Tax=Scheffersomyces xylosifermentans TaxID=1304137 RepID=UPI00315C8041